MKFKNIKTESIKLMGSKKTLIPHILEAVSKLPDVNMIYDGFSGSSRVSQAFAQSGYNVIANDIEPFAYHLAKCYLNGEITDRIIKYIRHFNGAFPKSAGWWSENYGGSNAGTKNTSIGLDGNKKPWRFHVTQRIDAIRPYIDEICNKGTFEHSVYLTSLMLALDKVDNTLGHHTSYLNKWSDRSYNQLDLKVPKMLDLKGNTHLVYNADVLDVLRRHWAYYCSEDSFMPDLAYYDPPYGSNNSKMPSSRVRYNSYYHLWNTICLNDKPELFGKANRRVDTKDTLVCNPYEDFRSGVAINEIRKLLETTLNTIKIKYVLLSYSNNGIVKKQDIEKIIKDNGWKHEIFGTSYKENVMAKMKKDGKYIPKKDDNKEYLFLIGRIKK